MGHDLNSLQGVNYKGNDAWEHNMEITPYLRRNRLNPKLCACTEEVEPDNQCRLVDGIFIRTPTHDLWYLTRLYNTPNPDTYICMQNPGQPMCPHNPLQPPPKVMGLSCRLGYQNASFLKMKRHVTPVRPLSS